MTALPHSGHPPESDVLGIGKAPPELLARIFQTAATGVIQGPGVGKDAAIIEWGDRALVVTSDPITFVDADAGKLAVTVNANDILSPSAPNREWLAGHRSSRLRWYFGFRRGRIPAHATCESACS